MDPRYGDLAGAELVFWTGVAFVAVLGLDVALVLTGAAGKGRATKFVLSSGCNRSNASFFSLATGLRASPGWLPGFGASSSLYKRRACSGFFWASKMRACASFDSSAVAEVGY